MQKLLNLGTKRFLTVMEPAGLRPSLTGEQYQLALNGGLGFTYDLETSTNLVDWTSLTNIQTTNMTMPVLALEAFQGPQQYFRAIGQSTDDEWRRFQLQAECSTSWQ